MKKIPLLSAMYGVIIFTVILLSAFNPKPKKCGGIERWQVKTLQDNSASKVKMTLRPATVSDLTQLITFTAKRSTQRQPVECQEYVVNCIIKDFFSEADGDIHIVIQDFNNSKITAIAESPDPNCSAVSGSKFEPQFKKVRQFFNDNGNSIKGMKVAITGVSFVDIVHAKPQRGVAPNNIEIHPVLNIVKL